MVNTSTGASQVVRRWNNRTSTMRAARARGVSPLTHVWMMRHTRREYVQLLHDVEAERRLFEQVRRERLMAVGEIAG